MGKNYRNMVFSVCLALIFHLHAQGQAEEESHLKTDQSEQKQEDDVRQDQDSSKNLNMEPSVDSSLDSNVSEPFLFSVELGYAMALTPPQSELFGPGASSAVAFHYPVLSWLLLGTRLQGVMLSDGASPEDAGRVDPDYGSFFALSGEVRFRPLATLENPKRATGLWLGAEGGGGLSGRLWRGFFGGALGWGFAWESVSLGPVVRFMQVIEPGPEVGGKEDARLLTAGLELVFNDARPKVTLVEEEEEVQEQAISYRSNGTVDVDQDGIYAPQDKCIEEPEDEDGFEDEDGCPDVDNDGDGVLDALDQCPLDKEDGDFFEDEDGCPDIDNDLDGIVDIEDWCPYLPEVINGVEDEDGCPDEGLIVFIENRIILDDHVLFDVERARVKSKAKPMIRAIVQLWKQHDEWKKVRIEGHSDVRGNPQYNLSLSTRRAKNTMKALVAAGMKKSLLEYKGFGSTKPRFTGSQTDNVHSRNRRVEFVVIKKGQSSSSIQQSPKKISKKTKKKNRFSLKVDEASLDEVDRWGEHFDDFVSVEEVKSKPIPGVTHPPENPNEDFNKLAKESQVQKATSSRVVQAPKKMPKNESAQITTDIETVPEVQSLSSKDQKPEPKKPMEKEPTQDEWDDPFEDGFETPQVEKQEKTEPGAAQPKEDASKNEVPEKDEWDDPFEEES